MRPKSYKDNLACANCKHVAAIHDYDEEPDYFCTSGAPERPKSGSTAMGETYLYDPSKALKLAEENIKNKVEVTEETMDEYTLQINPDLWAWMRWQKDRDVAPWGICDEYEAGDED